MQLGVYGPRVRQQSSAQVFDSAGLAEAALGVREDELQQAGWVPWPEDLVSALRGRPPFSEYEGLRAAPATVGGHWRPWATPSLVRVITARVRSIRPPLECVLSGRVRVTCEYPLHPQLLARASPRLSPLLSVHGLLTVRRPRVSEPALQVGWCDAPEDGAREVQWFARTRDAAWGLRGEVLVPWGEADGEDVDPLVLVNRLLVAELSAE